MMFIGKPNGKLMKGAPGNYIHGSIHPMPYRMSKFKFWKLMEEVPELHVPELGETVYEDAIYVPEDESEPLGEFTPMVPAEDINADPDTGATIEPYMTYSQKDGKMKAYVDKREPQPVPEPTPEPEPEPEEEEPGLDRDALKAILDEKGVKYLKNTRTITLAKMVEALEAKE